MVVVDNARKMISKTIDVVVTSVLQTTAGKMIFGRYLDPSQVTQSGTHTEDRPRSRSQVTSGTHAGTAGSGIVAPGSGIVTPASSGVPAAGSAAVPVAEPAQRAATPASGK
jgi:hypothetical protein